MNIATMYNKGSNLANTNNNNNSSNTNLNNNASTIVTKQSGSGSTTDRIEWSRATILDFIEDYRRQRVLWDPNNKGYHIKQTKYEALKLLGQKYGAEIRSIRSKIKSLRSSFHREHGKVLNSRRKGLNYQPMWFAYDAIRFILDGESGDSDEAETQKHDPNNRETALSESNSNKNVSIVDESLLEERKISSRDIEHFNNHFLALGLQARHPMVVIAAVEAAAAASAAQERRQEQKYALKQEDIDSATQLKLLELSTNATTTNANITSYNNTINLTSTSATFNPISKPFNSLKSLSPIATISSVPITTATLSNTTTTLPQQQQHQEQQLLPRPSPISTCSLESLNALHGSRSLDENSLSALVSATAIPNLSITAVARNSDYDCSEYCNISADDVKTEIFESDSTDLPMLESARTSTPVPLNYHKNATDLTMHKNNTNKLIDESGNGDTGKIAINGDSRTIGSRKRKPQKQSNLNYNEDAPTSSKLHQKQQQQHQQQQQLQHSNLIHSRQSDYLNRRIKNLNKKETLDNNEIVDERGNDGNVNDHDHDHDNDNDDEDIDDDGAGYFTSFSHLQTTLVNSNNSNSSNNNIHLTTTNSNSKLAHNNNNNNNSNNNNNTNNNNSNIPSDEYGVFGEYVAITIRKLKTSQAKIVVKHLINNLLYEAEMGKYDQGISANKEPPELYKM